MLVEFMHVAYWLRENQSVLLNVPLGVLVLKGTVKLFA